MQQTRKVLQIPADSELDSPQPSKKSGTTVKSTLPEDHAFERQLAAGVRDLAFARDIERMYRQELLRAAIPQLRLILGSGLVLITIFAILGATTQQSGDTENLNAMRAYLYLPLLLLALLSSFIPVVRGALPYLTTAAATAIGCGASIIAISSGEQQIGSAAMTVLLITLLLYLQLGLQFRQALCGAFFLFVFYVTASAYWNSFSVASFYTIGYLGFANLVGAIGAYNIEYHRRLSFLQSKVLKRASQTDALTGLKNRQAFDEQLERTWKFCVKERLPIGIALADVDNFKGFNDTYGHQAGDQCLRRIADEIAVAGKRSIDFGARYGGEEFAIVFAGAGAERLQEAVDELRIKVEQMQIENRASEVSSFVTLSIGVSFLYPHSTERSVSGAVQIADEALYQAKSEGRNRIVYGGEGDDPRFSTGLFRAPVSAV